MDEDDEAASLTPHLLRSIAAGLMQPSHRIFRLYKKGYSLLAAMLCCILLF